MACILHVSDLHFGKELRGSHKTKLRDTKMPGELAKKLHNHTNLLRKDIPHIDAIVITGDLTDGGLSGEFDLAAEFVTELLRVFELSTDAVLLVPGNHDINWRNEDLKDGKQYSDFRKFYTQVKAVEWHENSPTTIYFALPGEMDKNAIIFGFNSCQVENSLWRGLGLITDGQLNEMQTVLSGDDSHRFSLRLAALHHHVLPVHNYDPYLPVIDGKIDMVSLKGTEKPHLSVLLNSSKLLTRCQESKVTAVFHGHSHAPYLATQTRYYHSYYGYAHPPALSTAIIGNGSVTTDNEREFPYNHFQIIKFNRIGMHESYARIWSFMTRPGESIFGDLMQDRSVVIPTSIKRNDITERGLVEELNISLNEVLSNGYTVETYDSILRTSVNWLNSVAKSGFGCATISMFIPRLEIYRLTAKHNYPDSVKNLVYTFDDTSITSTCAIENRPIIVKRRKECAFASERYDHLYLSSIGGPDQTCLAVPLNSTNDTVPYAIISFARPVHNESDWYTDREVSILLNVRDVIENALRKAELAMTAHRRGQILELYNLLYDNVRREDNTNISTRFDKIVKLIYSYLSLSPLLHEAVAIFLPVPIPKNTAACVAQVGFGASTVDDLRYPIGVSDASGGLTGGIINSREYDYCLDHLKPNSISKRGRESSRRCQKDREPVTDHLLSFVGVPLGQGDQNYNRGALIINIATPMQVKDDTYIEEEYVRPMTIIASLLDSIIEGSWKKCFDSKLQRALRPASSGAADKTEIKSTEAGAPRKQKEKPKKEPKN